MQPDKGVPGSLIGTYYIMSPNISMQEIGLNFRPALHSIDSISLGYSKIYRSIWAILMLVFNQRQKNFS